MNNLLKEESVDFDSINFDYSNIERVFRQYLSYNKARLALSFPLVEEISDPSQEKYAKVILYFEKNGLLSALNRLVGELRFIYDGEMKRLGLESSQWGKDDTWIYWDIAKQSNFFLNKDRSGTNEEKYHIADPFTDERLRSEIVSRHIGWEFYGKHKRGVFIEPWVSNPEIRHLLKLKSSKPSTIDLGPPGWAIEKIGRLMRTTSS